MVCQTYRRNLQEKQNQIRGEVKTIHEEVNHYDAETERSSTRMAKDDEYIMSCFKDFVITRSVLISFYEMDAEQVASFNTNILRVERNVNPNDFPDFVGESMYVEVFNVSSSKEKSKGAQYFKENTELEKRMEEALKLPDDPDERKRGKSYAETLEYTGHSYDYWLSSLQRNIQSHKASRLKYSPNKNTEGVFLVRYSQKVLSYKDENDVEQWHRLGVDKKALSIIANELTGLIDYFILFNEKNSEAEVFPITKIPSYLCSHKLDYNFYPRKGAGEIRIGISEIIEPISFS